MTLFDLFVLNSNFKRVYVVFPWWITTILIYSFAFFCLEPQPASGTRFSSRYIHTVQGIIMDTRQFDFFCLEKRNKKEQLNLIYWFVFLSTVQFTVEFFYSIFNNFLQSCSWESFLTSLIFPSPFDLKSLHHEWKVYAFGVKIFFLFWEIYSCFWN